MIGDRVLKRVVRFDLRTKRRTVLASGFPEAIVGVAYDDMGRLYVSSGDRVYRIDGKRKVVVAGTGVRGHSGDGGPATAARLGGAGGFDVDHDEAIAIAEYDNWIRVVDPAGSISTAAGNGGEGYAGDGGPARDALMGHPHDVLWRRDRVLMSPTRTTASCVAWTPPGTISTFATGLGAVIDVTAAPGDVLFAADAQRGVLRVGPEGGAPTVVAYLPGAIGVVADVRGNVYASQLERRRVVRVSSAGRITPVVVR